MLRRLRRFSELSLAEAALLPLLALLSLGAIVGLRISSLPAVTRTIRSFRRLGSPARRISPARLFVLTDLAARITRGPDRCLPRSLLLLGLLGDPVELRVGVRRDSAHLEGHAWIQRGVEVLGDPPSETDRFTEIIRIQAS